MTDTAVQTHEFQAETGQVLQLVINSLYRNKDIFLRELISNASDALDKLRFRAITHAGLQEALPEIRIEADEANKTLTISDTGIGMTAEELVKNLGTIAHSGTKEFLKKFKETGNVELIGQFGVGFYSAFLVADRVEVVSRGAGTDSANKWTSNAEQTFTVEPATRDMHGTTITLHLRDDHKDYLNSWTLTRLVRQYSDYVSHPIKLKKDEEGEVEWETLNQAEALWQRAPGDITEEQYTEFYKHLTHDWDAPLAQTHFKIEGSQQFQGLLFIPKNPPFDLYDRNVKHGVRLYVNRVFIMEDCEELLPVWLRFMRGVIDANDLPLNVSREFLQDSRITKTIRKQIVKKVLDLLESLASDKKDDFEKFWKNFGRVLKEGIHFEYDQHDRLSKIVRFESTGVSGLTSLPDYVSRMKESQTAIYYALGSSRSSVESSPYLEALRSRGFEVLLMVDAIDQFAVEALREFDGKKLVSAMQADLQLPETEEEKKETEKAAADLKPLTEKMATILDGKVKEVKVSDRLLESPACLVIPDGGMHAHVERLMRQNSADAPNTPRILEINPKHSIITQLQSMQSSDASADELNEWIEVLYDQALIAEGSPIDEPGKFASRLTKLMTRALRAKA
jgi:molecular chaperone HtpG